MISYIGQCKDEAPHRLLEQTVAGFNEHRFILDVVYNVDVVVNTGIV